MRQSDKLNDVKCRNAKPQAKPYKLSDGRGLWLLVDTSGSRYWRYRYRIGGREKTLAFGVYPSVSLAEAREGREEARKLVKAGINPVQAKQKAKLERQVEAAQTFERVARKWHRQASIRWTDEHTAAILRTMERDLFPYIGNCPIVGLTAPQLLVVVRKVEERGALDVATRTIQRLNKIFSYAIINQIAVHNPARDLVGVVEKPKVVHRASLAARDLPNFFKRLDTFDGTETVRLALQMVVFTFVRSGELRGAKWDEFEGDVWRIPAERMKMTREHIVPLSTQSQAILKEIHALELPGEFVFPQERNFQKCISENAMQYAMNRMGYHGRATVHGFRSTASTILNERGFAPDVIERQLAHVESNSVRAAYNHSEYLPQRKELMQRWADYLDGVKCGDNIVSIFDRA
jgi:integrase